MEEKQSENTLLDIFASLRKHFLGMLIIFIAIVLLVTILTIRQTPIYEVGSSVMVKYGREYVYRPVEQVEEGDVQPLLMYNGLEVINTELEIFRSNELAEKVIESLGVEQLFSDLAQHVQDKKLSISLAINRFRNQLSVFHIKGSNVIGVTFQHRDPEIAVKAVSLLTELFKERHLQLFKNPQSSFLEEQVTLYHQQLQESEDALRTFKQENKIFSLDDQRKILMQQYVNVNTLLIEGESELEELGQRAASLAQQLETVSEAVVLYEESSQEGNIDDARAKLLKFKLYEHELAEKYPEGNRLLTAVRKDIDMVKEFIADYDVSSRENVRTGKNPVFQQVEKELVTVRAAHTGQEKKNDVIRQQLQVLKDRLLTMTKQETELKALKLKVETSEETYKTFVGKLEDSHIQEAMDSQKMVNVVVIEKPIVPIKPIKPRKKLNILVGIILGVASSLFYALFSEYVMVRKT